MVNVIFTPCKIKEWTGRYSRIEGDSSVFRVKSKKLIITSYRDYTKTLYEAKAMSAVNELIKAVIAGKRHLGGDSGGSFLINEFGQVLVPASDGSGRRVIVGEVKGTLMFHDPLTGKQIDLSDSKNLKPGDAWDRPYVGMPYNLDKASRIYFWRATSTGGSREDLPDTDGELISRLRGIRRTGAVRFVVNPYGLVLTKRPKNEVWNHEEEWEPVYVGNIRPQYWFKKEV